MREVAKRAGVSLATVSYVVNGGPRPVSRILRERVEETMRELGYEAAPRGRVRRRPRVVAALVPDATNSFFAQALAGAQEVLSAQGDLLLVASSAEDGEIERQQLLALHRSHVDGLLFTPRGPLPEELELLAARVPVVLMDRDGGTDRFPRVTMNDEQSAFRAVRVLAECGHRRIALINGPEHADTARHRRQGYRDALVMAGISWRPEYVREGPFEREFGRSATRALLGSPTPPDAIFSSSAILTVGVVEALREMGLSWPEDVAVIGFGDAPWAALLTPPLTIIDQPCRDVGAVAARLLTHGGGSERPEHVVLDSHLILRESHWKARQPEEVA